MTDVEGSNGAQTFLVEATVLNELNQAGGLAGGRGQEGWLPPARNMQQGASGWGCIAQRRCHQGRNSGPSRALLSKEGLRAGAVEVWGGRGAARCGVLCDGVRRHSLHSPPAAAQG